MMPRSDLYRWTENDTSPILTALVLEGVLVPVEPELWNVERYEGEVVSGGYSTRDDAMRARMWIENHLSPETFWLRQEGGDV